MVDITEGGVNQLRKNSLGLLAVTFMVISAAAPLTGVAGAMPLAFMLGNGSGVPATFIFATLVMLAFAAGYVAMSRHVTNAGAFYAYAARGLGGRTAGAVAIVALVAYNAMQFGLIGLFGAIAAGVFGEFGLVLPGWGWSLLAILLVGFLGYGVSLVLFVYALRDLGTARTAAYFSTAPFLGAIVALVFLHEPLTAQLLAAGLLMAAGVWLHVTEHHEHEHVHDPVLHAHPHVHDEHHRHEHAPDDPPGEPHTHPHRHEPLKHRHPHVPDMHHRHKH